MARSSLHAAPTILLKVAYEGGDEKTIGYCSNFSYSVAQGQKPIFTVDSPFPGEIAQGASASFVRGTIQLYLPKGSNPIKAGLVAPQTGPFPGTPGNPAAAADIPRQATSKYLHWRLYDRNTGLLMMSLNFCKVSNWSVTVQARSVIGVQLTFEGFYLESGLV